MINKMKNLTVITIISTILGLSTSYFVNNYLYSKIIEERDTQFITLEELIGSRIEALRMCVELSYNEEDNLKECSLMQHKIVDDIYTQLDSMPYTKFYYKYLDNNNTLEEIDRLKEIDIFTPNNKAKIEKL